MSGLGDELKQLMPSIRRDEQSPDERKVSEICRKRALGAVWYLARLNRQCGSVLLGLSAFSFVLAAGGFLSRQPIMVRLGEGMFGLMVGMISGSVGFVQIREARQTQRMTHKMLSDIEQGQPLRWSWKSDRICRYVSEGVLARLIVRLGRFPIIEYKGYNLWRRLNQKSRTV